MTTTDSPVLRVAGRPVGRYVTRPELPPRLAPRPYLHPVTTLAGTAVTELSPADQRVRLRVEIGPGARCRFFHDAGDGPRPSGVVFAATPWRWVGALLGLFALAPVGTGHAGAAAFTHFRITPL
ncbi:DUF6807 family protein [Streptomyces sediminimaris]|uniref:DUF6807 family protein n=1 Tax=Streptomyces sediminimaris TaxID=3383721 RepID=UPI0039999AB8